MLSQANLKNERGIRETNSKTNIAVIDATYAAAKRKLENSQVKRVRVY